MRYYTAMKVRCGRVIMRDGKKNFCPNTATFDNPNMDAPYILDRMAIEAGWFLQIGMSGNDLCPLHHREEALKYGIKSLYEEPKSIGVPLERVITGKVPDERRSS